MQYFSVHVRNKKIIQHAYIVFFCLQIVIYKKKTLLSYGIIILHYKMSKITQNKRHIYNHTYHHSTHMHMHNIPARAPYLLSVQNTSAGSQFFFKIYQNGNMCVCDGRSSIVVVV